MRIRRFVQRALSAATILLGIRVIYLFFSYISDESYTQRFHVESAAVLFIACGLTLAVLSGRSEIASQARAGTPSIGLWAACCGLSLTLYWPALSVGFLSDDFVLVTRAANWQLGPVTPALFRPLPLLLWALLSQMGSGPIAFHLLNVLMHGTNGFLAACVVADWLRGRNLTWLAACLFVTAPLAVEAVVWCSGIFDVLATTLILLCVLVSRRYGYRPSWRTRALFVFTLMAAVASKETAVVGFLFVFLDAWARNALPRKLLSDIVACAAIVAAFSLIRLTSAFGIERPPFSKYLIQRAIFGAFGGLAVPWHVEVIRADTGLVVVACGSIVAVATMFFVLDRTPQHLKRALVACGWILLPTLPVFSVFYIAPDLQGSRYLYLSGLGWSALLATFAIGRDRYRIVASGLIAVVVGCNIFGTRQQLQPWVRAAFLRDSVESAAANLKRAGCKVLSVVGAPDTEAGAYVFRNGLREAFQRDLQMSVSPDSAPGVCTVQWDHSSRAFVQIDRN